MDDQLEKKYKPSAWNPDLSSDEVIEKYLRIGRECECPRGPSLNQCTPETLMCSFHSQAETKTAASSSAT